LEEKKKGEKKRKGRNTGPELKRKKKKGSIQSAFRHKRRGKGEKKKGKVRMVRPHPAGRGGGGKRRNAWMSSAGRGKREEGDLLEVPLKKKEKKKGGEKLSCLPSAIGGKGGKGGKNEHPF